jgi:hydroxyacylglutathione hydrolase
MTELLVDQIAVLSDNYVYLVRDGASGTTAVVDPAVAEPVRAALAQRDWRLDFILNTHHHSDHVGGNLALKQWSGARIIGPASDADRIPGIDVGLDDNDRFALGQAIATILAVPGHTRGHIAFWFADAATLFCGDTLFALGCGRMFEGTPEQMWASLKKLRALPDATRVYCAHEYTEANARFARTIEPDNPILAARAESVAARRRRGLPTVPSLLGEEKATNPFLRADVAALQAAMGMAGGDPAAVWGQLRRRKDVF